MYTPTDSAWVRDNREREIYQVSEARWSVEGAVVPDPQHPGFSLKILKRIFQRPHGQELQKTPVMVAQEG